MSTGQVDLDNTQLKCSSIVLRFHGCQTCIMAAQGDMTTWMGEISQDPAPGEDYRQSMDAERKNPFPPGQLPLGCSVPCVQP